MFDNRVNTLPTVSVIVPVFNEEAHVKDLIESLLALDYPNDKYEIIIVDNNSTDNTATVIKSCPVVYLLEDAIQSSYAARNMGIRNAKGNILAFTDGDCVVDKSWLKSAVAVLERHEADIVSGSIIFIGNKLNILALNDIPMSGDSQRIAAERGQSAGGNLIVRRGVFKRVGLFDARLVSGGDVEWTARATSAGFKIKYCNIAKVYHSICTLSEVLERSIRIGFGKGQIAHLASHADRQQRSPDSKQGSYTKWISHSLEIYMQRLRKVSEMAQRGNVGIVRHLQLIILSLFLQTLTFCGWLIGRYKDF